jgi:hypothetical protein
VHAERADAGLIVTTNDISPGAAKVVEARAYPVTVANRDQVLRLAPIFAKPRKLLLHQLESALSMESPSRMRLHNIGSW